MRAIILIVIDCLRADHVSCCGYDRPTTPTIDAMASAGTVWERAYSASSWTKPSVASLLTGLYPTQHGALLGIKRSKNRTVVTTDALQTTTPTLAECFTRGGWRCGAFINNAQLGPFTRLNRGFQQYVPTAGKADGLIAQFAEWINADSKTPAFAYLHFLEAHWPYKPRRRHIAMFGGDRDTNCYRDYSARDFGRLRHAVSKGEATISDDELEQLIQMYDGAVRRLDGKIKIVQSALKAMGIADESAIVVTADHGDEFLDHKRIGHGQSLHAELTHVPLIASVPGWKEGVRNQQPVSHIDLARTLLEIGGVSAEGIPGQDLHADGVTPSPVCSELQIRRRYTQCLRTANWTAMRHYKFGESNDSFEVRPPRVLFDTLPHTFTNALYQFGTDPHEHTDLFSDQAHSAGAQEMTGLLDSWWDGTADLAARSNAGDVELDPRVVERLRALGYLD